MPHFGGDVRGVSYRGDVTVYCIPQGQATYYFKRRTLYPTPPTEDQSTDAAKVCNNMLQNRRRQPGIPSLEEILISWAGIVNQSEVGAPPSEMSTFQFCPGR